MSQRDPAGVAAAGEQIPPASRRQGEHGGAPAAAAGQAHGQAGGDGDRTVAAGEAERVPGGLAVRGERHVRQAVRQPPAPLLRVRDLRAAYGALPVLHGLDLEVGAGEVVVLLGANGAGKTTTLRALSGPAPGTGLVVRGDIELAGVPVLGRSAPELVRLGIAHVPQGRGTLPGLTVEDNLRAGAISGFAPVMEKVVDAAQGGMPVLGICNGFQILCETHLLPGAMIKNAHRAFLCRDQPLTVENNRTAWTSGYEAGQVIRIPLKNQDGQYVADERTLAELEDEGRIVFRYAAGATHVLPTGGLARSTGGLGLEAFLKPVQVVTATPEGARRAAEVIVPLARVEGLPLHAAAA